MKLPQIRIEIILFYCNMLLKMNSHKPRGLKPCGLSLALARRGGDIRDDRRHDTRPQSDVFSRVDIGVRRVSAGAAKELGLTATVGFFDMSTARALLAGVFRVHQDDRNTGQPRLVVDELPQLGETPIAVPRSLFGSSSPGPRADARQVFQGNRAVRALAERGVTSGQVKRGKKRTR